MRLWSFLFVALFTHSTAFALGPIPGEERFAGVSQDENEAGAALGFGQIGEDFFLQLTPRLDLNLGKIGLGLQVPLNLRVLDRGVENDAFELREQDWDETSDYLRLIRYVRYGYKFNDDPFYARVGELAADIGHGTIMARYLNNVDIDTFRLGTQLDVYTNYGGIETVVGDVGSLFAETPESRIVGTRVYFKPYSLVDPESLLNIFAIGFSAVSDMNAPREIAQTAGEDGQLVSEIDEEGNLVVANDGAQTVWGVDLEARVLNTAMIQITPYTDLNFIDGAGWGWHLGSLFNFRMPIGFDLTIPVRLEYRRFRSDYVPTYFSTFYEVERYAFPAGSGGTPKSRAVRQMPDGDGINGYYGDLAFNFADLIQVGAIYEDYSNGDPNLAAFASVPAIEVVQLKAFYTRTGITGAADIFELDDRSLLIAQGRYELFTFVYLVGRWTRSWILDNEAGSDTYGTFQASDDWKVGLEVAFEF